MTNKNNNITTVTGEVTFASKRLFKYNKLTGENIEDENGFASLTIAINPEPKIEEALGKRYYKADDKDYAVISFSIPKSALSIFDCGVKTGDDVELTFEHTVSSITKKPRVVLKTITVL